MKKIIKIFLLLFVTSGGVFLNTFYYIFAFLNAGYGKISFVFAIFLMLFEIVLWYYAKHKLALVFLKIPLLIFSISMTLGSQFLSTSINETTTKTDIKKTEIVNDKIAYYKEQIKSLDNQINKHIDLETKFAWHDTITAPSIIARQNAEKKRDNFFILKEKASDKMLSEDTKIYRPKNIYQFWAEKIKSNAPDNIRFWYQLAGSIFIALMSPVCIHLLSLGNTPGKLKDEISKIDKENIVKMLLWDFPKMKTPKEAVEEFKRINIDRPNIPVYDLKDCKAMLKKIKKVKSDNIEVIKKEVMK